MNYRHAFHAGNFADVLKHVVLTRLIAYLKRKDSAFRIIDTHAGSGLYDLHADEASRTAEWRGGIGKLVDAELAGDARQVLEPYLEAVQAVNPTGGLQHYPGSPVIARHLLRRQDRLSLLELHSGEVERLRSLFDGDIRTRVIHLDGWLALGAHLPPKEKRGLVLIDPPFEKPGEFDRMIDGLIKAHRRWPGGIYALWYPLKDRAAVAAFRNRLANATIPKILDVWQTISKADSEPRLHGSGMIVVNPPYVLEQELRYVLPDLTRLLAQDGGAAWGMDQLAGEQAAT